MKTTLFKKLESLVTTGDEKATQDAMQDWEWGFNTAHKNGGFPNFGLTPMQRVVAFSRGKA